jgi:hypothetical protein
MEDASMTTINRGVSTLLAVLVLLAFAPLSGSALLALTSAQGFAMQGASTVSNKDPLWIGLPYTSNLTGQDVRAPTLTPSAYFLSMEAQLIEELIATDPIAPYIDKQQLFDALIEMTEPFRLTYRQLDFGG